MNREQKTYKMGDEDNSIVILVTKSTPWHPHLAQKNLAWSNWTHTVVLLNGSTATSEQIDERWWTEISEKDGEEKLRSSFVSDGWKEFAI